MQGGCNTASRIAVYKEINSIPSDWLPIDPDPMSMVAAAPALSGLRALCRLKQMTQVPERCYTSPVRHLCPVPLPLSSDL